MPSTMEVEDTNFHHVQKRQFTSYNLGVILAMCSTASVSMGYSASIIGPSLGQPSFIEFFELATRPDATPLLATMNGLFQAGAFLGSFGINIIGDRFGRKASIATACALVLISGACLAGSVNIGMFIAFRFLSGMGSWWLLGSVPVWISEISPPHNRGGLVDIHSAFLLIGYATAAWIGYAFFHFHPAANNQWRAPIAFQCLPPFLNLCIIRFLPESPRWLLSKGREQEARVVLEKLHGREEMEVEFKEIKAQILSDSAYESSWKAVVTKPSYRKRALLTMAVAFGVQMTGVLVVNNYGASIYGSLGFDGEHALLYQGAFNTLAAGCGMLAVFLVDLFPRNKFISIGMAIILLCLVLEAALVANFPFGVPGQNAGASKAALAMLFLYISFSQFTVDGAQYIYYSELWPSHLRAKGMTIAMSSIALINVLWLEVAPIAFAAIEWKFYLVFIVPGYLFAIGAWFILPNTRHLSLEQIAALFGDAVEIRDPADSIKGSEATAERIEHAGGLKSG